MRILIDLLHPAHVHFFRNFRLQMLSLGHNLLVTARDKDVTVALLDHYSIPAEVISEQCHGRAGLGLEMITRTRRLLRIARRWKPDLLAGIMGPSIAVVGRLLQIPAIVFYDTEMAFATNRWVYPLATTVVTPESYRGRVRGRHVTYRGYHELAYLHPTRFTPDDAVLGHFGIRLGEPFSLIRFVSWEASHDVREVALTAEQKRALVSELSHRGRVLISSEGTLPADLYALRVTGPPAEVHHLVAHANIVVGESATMSSEASVLGVPSVFISKTGRGYIDDQQRRYGLTEHVRPDEFEKAFEAIDRLAATSTHWRSAQRARLLEDHIDVTQWMVDYIWDRQSE